MKATAKARTPADKKNLSPKQREELLKRLQARFEKNMLRHEGLEWAPIQARLEANAGKLWSLAEMERSGGEPDVIGRDQGTGGYIFCDCSLQTPKGRIHTCYDRAGQEAREKKGVRPKGNALDMAAARGIELLTEQEYRELQKLGDFDTTTQSWIKTPPAIRKLGGALFMDRRFDTVFVYHNTAPCFFGNRGFRGSLRV